MANNSISEQEFQEIVNNNTVTIPASLLVFHIKFMEMVTARSGVVRPSEMVNIGNNYEYSANVINSLVNSYIEKPKIPLESIPEENESKKTKKKGKKKKQNRNVSVN